MLTPLETELLEALKLVGVCAVEDCRVPGCVNVRNLIARAEAKAAEARSEGGLLKGPEGVC